MPITRTMPLRFGRSNRRRRRPLQSHAGRASGTVAGTSASEAPPDIRDFERLTHRRLALAGSCVVECL